MNEMSEIVFGPVPSRRLGVSLGINNVFYKYCTYSCIYCQLGRTTHYRINRRSFYDAKVVANEVISAIEKLEGKVDYITFVPDGEPTLDANLGKIVELIKREISIPIAIITNSSLLYRRDVREDISLMDLVSLKVDSVDNAVWRVINRPHGELNLKLILNGVLEFSDDYQGKLITETMTVRGINDSIEHFESVARFLSEVDPFKCYISIPIRPPAEKWVKLPSEKNILSGFKVFSDVLGENKVELLTGYEGPDFKFIEDPIKSLLAIASVHPIRIDYAVRLIDDAGLDSDDIINRLLSSGEIVLIDYGEHKFLLKKFVKN